jgi:drug/metabolite transporter (DMT)-like permease
MIGYLFAVLTSLFYGFQGAYGKILTKHFSAAMITWGTFTFTVPYIMIFLFTKGVPKVIWFDFVWTTLTSFLINVFAFNLFFRALSVSSLSLTMPFTAFTPLFMVPITYLLLDELPGLLGLGGMLLIIAGAYGLHLNSKNLLLPFKNLFREKGTRYMLIVSLVWAVSASVEKVAVLSSSAEFYGLVINTLLALTYLPYVLVFHKRGFQEVPQHFRKFLLIGFISGLMIIFQFTAYEYLQASYVIAFKRSGVIFSVVLGYLFFKEKKIAKNLFFTFLMIAGVILLMFG